MLKKLSFVFIFLFFVQISFGQYNMQNLTVNECFGTLKDSESNPLIGTYYNHQENYSFTICPPGAISIDIIFTFFETEPTFDYLRIFDGPDTNSPLIGGPYSGNNLPPVINSNGCVTINFISDNNVALEGFELFWESQLTPPSNPNMSLPTNPTCSTNVLTITLDQMLHCDSVPTATIFIAGQINQVVNAVALGCINDSTNTIQLNLFPGLNESGAYNIFFQSYFKDICDSIWQLQSFFNFVVNDCPLQVNLSTNNDSICVGGNTNIFAMVSGGDSTSYNFNWSPFLPSSAGPHNVAPLVTTTYYLTVSDAGPAASQTDSITIYVLPLPTLQNDTTVCQTSPNFNLTASPIGGWWWGFGIVNGGQGLFSPSLVGGGIHTVAYGYGGCSSNMDVNVLEINAGADIAACPNAPTFNLNTSMTTPGGVWGGCNCIQSNGDISVSGFPSTINAVYTLPNGCSDTLQIIINNISTQPDDTVCQKSTNLPLVFSPQNGFWDVSPSFPIQASTCPNSIINYPFTDNFELGLTNWTNDPLNNFNWIINAGSTPSNGTGPISAYEGLYYTYTEASGTNFPYKRSGIISTCLNLSAYSNPILHFWYHMYDDPSDGPNQGTFSVDVSMDNGATWTNDIWFRSGNQGNQWLEASIDLSNFISSEVLIRLRVITGNSWQSDVAVDLVSFLGGPITPDGIFLSSVADSGSHTLIYHIQGCSDTVNIYVKPIDAGADLEVCPTEPVFNLVGAPNGGIWNGTHIINTNSGLFDPSLGLGADVVTYSAAGCTDSAIVLVLQTDIILDSVFTCNDGAIIILDSINIPRFPTNGTWSGNGIIASSYPGAFDPVIAGSGQHIIIYTANNCSDSIVFDVAPQSIITDTMVCESSPNFYLSAFPNGGLWGGTGIINNFTGLFSPTLAGLGVHYVIYRSPKGCFDTTSVTVYANPSLSMSGVGGNYCFKDTSIQIIVNPSGGVLSGDGINNLQFNPYNAGPGYHVITYAYGSGNCQVSIDTLVLVGDSLSITTYASDDSICSGEIVNIGVNVSGGSGTNYSFLWDNLLGTSFEHNVSPIVNTTYNVEVSDACSQPVSESVDIFVHPNFNLFFTTSPKKCHGEYGFAKVNVVGNSSFSYQWNTLPISFSDSIVAEVAKTYTVVVTDNISQCKVMDTISIPGYDNLIASFYVNKEHCISLLDGTFQFLDNSNININEIASSSYWNFGDSTTIPYVYGNNPSHIYADTGQYQVSLILVNNGNCADTSTLSICVIPDKKLFIPNSFTPNLDHCNDEFFVKGVGGFYNFNIKIYKRWGGDIVFESDEIILTDNYSDGNLCASHQDFTTYYKMGTWNGFLSNGNEAPLGVYAFIVQYKQLENSPIETIVGIVTLVR